MIEIVCDQCGVGFGIVSPIYRLSCTSASGIKLLDNAEWIVDLHWDCIEAWVNRG